MTTSSSSLVNSTRFSRKTIERLLIVGRPAAYGWRDAAAPPSSSRIAPVTIDVANMAAGMQ
jgi:hypothetical protein